MTEPTTFLLSLLLAAQAQATETPAADAAAQPVEEAAAAAAKAKDDNKVICKRTAVTGSKFKKKICGTKKDWADMAARSESTTHEMQRNGKGLEPVR